MHVPTDHEIEGRLVAIISDGFNRSLGALEGAGAVRTDELRRKYSGVGAEYYDLVTEQIELTAKWAVSSVRELFRTPGSGSDPDP